MLDRFRKVILGLNVEGNERSVTKETRSLVAKGISLLREPAKAVERLRSLANIQALHEIETGTWVAPETLAQGLGGPFDSVDLRHWLALAKRAGVPCVNARPILQLSEAEMSALSGIVKLPESAGLNKMRENSRMLEKIAKELDAENIKTAEDDDLSGSDEPIDMEKLVEKLYAAMDNVPEGWMVRSNRSGASSLKTLAGTGIAGHVAPEVRFGSNLEIGPGWIRTGNRRRIDVNDLRIMKSAAEGPADGSVTFVARPWVEADRYFIGEDPHRHGSIFAGKGEWPAEWRVFVENNEVVGVSAYYGWCGEITAENARKALEAADLAQKIVDEALRQKAWPRFMDIEFARNNDHPDIKNNPLVQANLEKFGREKIACTLDFIETSNGMMLLEGGPAASPFGGGHVCAFAGTGGPPRLMRHVAEINGIAFKTMPHINLADMKTWVDGVRDDSILTFDEVGAFLLAVEASEEQADLRAEI